MILRVGSFNVRQDNPADGPHRWDARRETLLALLRNWNPDILSLQEPFPHQLAYLEDNLSEYGVVGVGREDGKTAGEFCPLFYRRTRWRVAASGTFWLSETPDAPGSRGWGTWHPRICTWVRLVERSEGTAFFVYNLHLDHEKQEARERGLDLVMERIRQRTSPDPVIVMGDFNATPDNPALMGLSSPGSPTPVNAFIAAGVTDGTFHGFTGQAQGGPIDHLFLSPEWQVRSAQVLHGNDTRPFPSDHFPIAADIELR